MFVTLRRVARLQAEPGKHLLGQRRAIGPCEGEGAERATDLRCEYFLQLPPCAQQPRLHRRDGNAENLGRFLTTKALDLAEHEYGAERLWKRGDRVFQD